MASLPIVWQRLVTHGATCPRCDGTQAQLTRAMATLRSALGPLGIEPVLLRLRRCGVPDDRTRRRVL